MSLVVAVAQAVTDGLNTAPKGAFAMAFTAQRRYRPVFDLTELKELRVTVVAKGLVLANLGRGPNQDDVAVDVAVQKRVDANNTSELDALMELAEQIGGYFRQKRLASYPAAVWVKTEHTPIYAPEHLDSKQVFTSVMTLTFRVMK